MVGNRESSSTLYVGIPQKQNGRQYNPMQGDHCKAHTNKQDLTFQNHPEVVSVYIMVPDNVDKVVNQ